MDLSPKSDRSTHQSHFAHHQTVALRSALALFPLLLGVLGVSLSMRRLALGILHLPTIATLTPTLYGPKFRRGPTLVYRTVVVTQ